MKSGMSYNVVWTASDLAGVTEAELSLWRGGTKVQVIDYDLDPSTGTLAWTPRTTLESASDYTLGFEWPWYLEDLRAMGPTFTILGANVVRNQPVSCEVQPGIEKVIRGTLLIILRACTAVDLSPPCNASDMDKVVDGSLATRGYFMANSPAPGVSSAQTEAES